MRSGYVEKASEQTLEELGLLSLRKRRQKGGMQRVFQIVKDTVKEDGGYCFHICWGAGQEALILICKKGGSG